MPYYDLLSAQKLITPSISTPDISGLLPTPNGSLIVTIGKVQSYIEFPRIVFIRSDSCNPVQTFRKINLADVRTYAENIDRYDFAPRIGQQEEFWFYVDVGKHESWLLYGQGTVTGVVEGVSVVVLE
ncbi:hypothetical protein BDW74DRAFT_180185 [Aspergillus multicolor]|uniref:uncharacterized protein n=1 Tax=Aspergillus multicolor TaxID=41759 RepID=UPI003CCDEA66